MPTFSGKAGGSLSLRFQMVFLLSWLPSLVCMLDQLSVAPTGIIRLACSLVPLAHLELLQRDLSAAKIMVKVHYSLGILASEPL